METVVSISFKSSTQTTDITPNLSGQILISFIVNLITVLMNPTFTFVTTNHENIRIIFMICLEANRTEISVIEYSETSITNSL